MQRRHQAAWVQYLLFGGKTADDLAGEVLIDLTMPRDGFSSPRNDISVDVMPATIANKYDRMFVCQQTNEVKALHA